MYAVRVAQYQNSKLKTEYTYGCDNWATQQERAQLLAAAVNRSAPVFCGKCIHTRLPLSMALVPFSYASPFTDQLKAKERLFTINDRLLRVQQVTRTLIIIGCNKVNTILIVI